MSSLTVHCICYRIKYTVLIATSTIQGSAGSIATICESFFGEFLVEWGIFRVKCIKPQSRRWLLYCYRKAESRGWEDLVINRRWALCSLMERQDIWRYASSDRRVESIPDKIEIMEDKDYQTQMHVPEERGQPEGLWSHILKFRKKKVLPHWHNPSPSSSTNNNTSKTNKTVQETLSLLQDPSPGTAQSEHSSFPSPEVLGEVTF